MIGRAKGSWWLLAGIWLSWQGQFGWTYRVKKQSCILCPRGLRTNLQTTKDNKRETLFVKWTNNTAEEMWDQVPKLDCLGFCFCYLFIWRCWVLVVVCRVWGPCPGSTVLATGPSGKSQMTWVYSLPLPLPVVEPSVSCLTFLWLSFFIFNMVIIRALSSWIVVKVPWVNIREELEQYPTLLSTTWVFIAVRNDYKINQCKCECLS